MADILKVKTGSGPSAQWRGIPAIKGEKGDTGDTGPQGPKGDTGTGVPPAGLTNQVLKKNSNTDYDFKWEYETQSSTTWGQIVGTLSDQIDLNAALNGKQATLISGTSIKTLNNESLLGSGNISINGAEWGNITGTLTNQTDLNTALGLKADGTDVEAIEELIPAQATSSNQLADKSFVNSSIATNTAYYINNNGQPFNSVAELEAYSGTITNNDYAFVTGTDEHGDTFYDRYKATVNGGTTTWAKEFRLNNSSFTANQWAAITSGITSGLVTAFGNKYDLPVSGIPKTDLASGVQASLDLADSALQSHQDISGKENTSNKVTSISSSSTDTEYPSAKCVYDIIGNVEAALAALR